MQSDPTDPQRDALYRAESAAQPDGGRRFRRFTELQDYVLGATGDPFWEQRFPDAPVQVDVLRRSRGATFSAAHVDPDGWDAVIWIRDGSWNLVTVVHELAHVAVGGRSGRSADEPAHGPRFAAALADLWRHHLGVQSYGALLGAFDDQGVEYQWDRRPGSPAGA
jgi:putative metallohydrolase (TIGR04338 family)